MGSDIASLRAGLSLKRTEHLRKQVRENTPVRSSEPVVLSGSSALSYGQQRILKQKVDLIPGSESDAIERLRWAFERSRKRLYDRLMVFMDSQDCECEGQNNNG